jgi:RecB family endonuclease NucS
MRLLVARCEVVYTGRLSTVLPEATRLLMFKDDGSFLVHDDAGGYKPLNRIRSVFRPGVPRLVVRLIALCDVRRTRGHTSR